MKIKLALLLALITSAGLLAQDAPKPDAPKTCAYEPDDEPPCGEKATHVLKLRVLFDPPFETYRCERHVSEHGALKLVSTATIEEAAKVEPATLRVYTDGIWWVVAFSPEDAARVWEEAWGDVRRRTDPPFVKETRDTLRVTDVAHETASSMSPAEWAKVKGRGILAATDWGTW